MIDARLFHILVNSFGKILLPGLMMTIPLTANIKIAALTEEASHVAIPLRKGGESDNLQAAINEALAELSETGELSELSMKYFGSDISTAH